jgi:hypothetical protein
MRGKIIAVFAVVVLIMGGLFYALTRATLADLATPGEVARTLAGASAQLQLDGLVLERWLANRASEPRAREPFSAALASARGEAATSFANQLRDGAVGTPELASRSIALVAVVDKNGVVVGRNGSALMRGDDLGVVYPLLKKTLGRGATGSDVWVNRARNEQMLASYAPVRDADGSVLGGLVVGTALNDERLTNASDRTSGRPLLAAVKSGDALDVVAKSSGVTAELAGDMARAKDAAFQALATNQVVDLPGFPKEYTASAVALDGYGDGHRLVLASITQLQTPVLLGSLVGPAVGVTILGLVLVVAAAWLLGAYISRPIAEIEDGLLAIMNGRADLRFEIEHPELGGLVFRLNSLLNQLLEVQEDDTDEQGRKPPAAASFQDALAVDERMTSMSLVENLAAMALRNEPEEAYYNRIFGDYVAAKKDLGDPVDHISKESFLARIKASEAEMTQKHGKPVRYKVEVQGKEVVLLAMPLV